MPTTPTDPGAAPAPKGLVARVIGIIVAPRETFASVVAHPRWLGMLALTVLVGIAAVSGLMMTERGRQAALDAQVAQMENFGVTVDDQMYRNMERQMAIAPYTAAAGVLVSVPLMYLIVAGILFVVFNAVMGGSATFRQLFTVVVHVGPVGLLHQLFTVPVSIARGTMGSVSHLGMLVPMLDEKSLVARFLGSIDVFYIWQFLVLAIGLGVLYRRRTQPIATTLLVIYGGIALIVAFVMSRLGGA